MNKFINVKLNGSNESMLNEPRMNGNIYKIRKRLFKYFSIIY